MTMKNHLPSAIILFVLLLAFCFHAIAADNKSYSGTSTLASTQSGYLFTSTLETSSVDYLDVIDPVATDTVATLLRTTTGYYRQRDLDRRPNRHNHCGRHNLSFHHASPPGTFPKRLGHPEKWTAHCIRQRPLSGSHRRRSLFYGQ